MSLTAARTELNLAIAGDDQTGELLEAASKRVSMLEAKLGDLTKATKAQTQVAQQNQAAMTQLNSSMTALGKQGEALITGFDKMKGSLGKITGAFGFWGAAITGGVAVIGELIDALGSFESAAEKAHKATLKQIEAHREAAAAAHEQSRALTELAMTEAAASASRESMTELQLRLAKAAGQATRAEQLEQQLAVERATAEYNQQADSVNKLAEEHRRLQIELRLAQEDLDALGRDRRIRDVADIRRVREEREARQQSLTEARNRLLEIESDQKRVGRQYDAEIQKLETLRDLAREAVVVRFDEGEAAAALSPGRAERGRGRRAEQRETEEQRRERELAELFKQIEKNAKAEEDARAAAERFHAEFMREMAEKKAAREEEELMRERAEEVLRRAGEVKAARQVIDFAGALKDLGPELSAVEQHMSRLSDVWQAFIDKNATLEEALLGSARAVAGAVAEQVGGTQALAAVEAAFHFAKGIGTAFTNPAESVGHFAAAAGLTAVAAGAIGGGGGSKPASASKPAPERREERREDAGPTVYNFSAGVMDGQSVMAAMRQAERASRGTGMSREMGV